MMQVAMTGGDGFLGWHTRCALLAQGTVARDIPVGSFYDADQAVAAVDAADRFIHLAGVVRGTDLEVEAGSVLFAEQAAQALRAVARPPSAVIYANSIQAALDNAYGRAKTRVSEILASAAADIGATYVDMRLPNQFGEHGRPFYNAVTSTFCHIIAQGGAPEVVDDKLLTLMHAQDAADLLIGNRDPDVMDSLSRPVMVSELLHRLTAIARCYEHGDIPDVSDEFSRNLFNTYRSHSPPLTTGFELTPRLDESGRFIDVVRSHGGCGQVSFSTTGPAVTTGQYFHRRKIERIVVLSGQATIKLRRCCYSDTTVIPVSGERPMAVDIPTMWTHSITNTGGDLLHTAFWTDEPFDPAMPDTTPEAV